MGIKPWLFLKRELELPFIYPYHPFLLLPIYISVPVSINRRPFGNVFIYFLAENLTSLLNMYVEYEIAPGETLKLC